MTEKEPEKRKTAAIPRPSAAKAPSPRSSGAHAAVPPSTGAQPTARRSTAAVKRPTEPQAAVKGPPPKAGLSLIEIGMLLAIVVSATVVLLPKLEDRKRQAVAAEILQDVDAVRRAMFTFYSDSGYFPRSVTGGGLPASIVRYLPQGYAPRKQAWTVGYESWSNRTRSLHVKTKQQIGVTITTDNAKLGSTAMDLYGNYPKYAVGSKYVFMIAGL